MSNVEHYFENYLFYDSDIVDKDGNEINGKYLSEETKDAIKQCAHYIKWSLFAGYTFKGYEVVNANGVSIDDLCYCNLDDEDYY